MLIGLVAFIAGMFAAYLSLRAVGWLIVTALVFLSFEAQASYSYTVNYPYDSNAGHYYVIKIQVKSVEDGLWYDVSSGAVNGYHPSTSVTKSGCTYYPNAPFGQPNEVRLKWNWYGNTSCGDRLSASQTVNDGGSVTFSINGCDDASQPAVTNYFLAGCVTNLTMYPRRVRVVLTPVSGNPQTLVSPNLILPGEYWCAYATNQVPTEAKYEVDIYDGEGGFLGTQAGSSWWLPTNSVPGSPVGGSVPPTIGSGGNNSPLNLDNNETAGGLTSTNPVTGSQYIAGVTNLMNTLYQGFERIGSGLGRLLTNSIAMQNGAGSNSIAMDLTWTNWLVAISNNTQIDSNYLKGVLSDTNYAGFSNSVWEVANVASNNWFSLLSTNSTSWAGITNDLYSGADANLNLFYIPWPTNISGGMAKNAGQTFFGGFDLNFMLSKWGQRLAPWIRLFFVFLLGILAVRYIRDQVFENVRWLVVTPGNNPMTKGNALSWLRPFLSVTAFSAAIAVMPVVLGALISGLGAYIDATTPNFLMPLSNAGILYAGEAAPWIKLGVWILKQCFPWFYAISICVYCFFVDNVIFVAFIWASRIVRHVT